MNKDQLCKALENDIKGYLLSDSVEVSVTEGLRKKGEEMEGVYNIGIVIGKAKKGGLYYGFTVDQADIKITAEVAIRMLQSQLILYAIECLKAGKKVSVPPAKPPQVESTLLGGNAIMAQKDWLSTAEAVNSYSIFKDTYYDNSK